MPGASDIVNSPKTALLGACSLTASKHVPEEKGMAPSSPVAELILKRVLLLPTETSHSSVLRRDPVVKS